MYYLCLCTLNCLVSYTPPSCLLVIYAIHFKRWISKYISACIIKTSHFQIWWISHIIWRINFNFMSQDGSCFIVLVFFWFFFNETVRKILEAKKQQKKKRKEKLKTPPAHSVCRTTQAEIYPMHIQSSNVSLSFQRALIKNHRSAIYSICSLKSIFHSAMLQSCLWLTLSPPLLILHNKPLKSTNKNTLFDFGFFF